MKGAEPGEKEQAKQRYVLEGLNCAQCAVNIEQDLNKIEGIQNARINFLEKTIEIDSKYEKELKRAVQHHEFSVRIRQENLSDDQKGDEGDNKSPGILRSTGLRLIVISAVLFTAGMFTMYLTGMKEWRFNPALIFFSSAYLLSGAGVLRKAFLNSIHGKLFDEHFLMTIATAGAIFLGEYPEAAAVMLFYSVGEYLQGRAVENSRRSIKALLDLRPDFARVVRDGKSEKVSPRNVEAGEYIEIRAGESIPLDGLIVRGESFVDTSALTGESVLEKVDQGDEVLSGSINGDGLLILEVKHDLASSAVTKIISLVQQAAEKKARPESFITKFARYYTPIVVFLALLVSIGPPLFLGAALELWIYRALVLLVISCPCALVVSIPLSYFAGVGKAAKEGILVKGAEYLDRLQEVKTAAFDKTGTLTRGEFTVREIVPAEGASRKDLLLYAAAAEEKSNHPISTSIKKAFAADSAFSLAKQFSNMEEFKEVRGRGILCRWQGRVIAAGNEELMEETGVPTGDAAVEGTTVHVAVDGRYVGHLVIGDRIRDETKEVMEELRSMGIHRQIMLTGDGYHAAAYTAREAGIHEFYSELKPEDKVDRIFELKKAQNKSPVLFLGDGINDAPVLAGSDIGVAMGGIGSDAALEAADMVLMRDDLSSLPKAIRLSKRTRRIVFQNIILALSVKIAVAGFGIIGLATMWAAVFADVGVTLIAVANSLRILKNEEKKIRR